MDMDETIRCWRINYGMDTRTPMQAAQSWRDHSGGAELSAPAAAVAALGTAIEEIERLRDVLQHVLRWVYNGACLMQASAIRQEIEEALRGEGE